MSPLDTFLTRPSNRWRIDEREAAWRALCALVDALPDAEVPTAVARADELLARAYEDAGTSAVYFEDDQRVAPPHWCLPAPRPALALAREVALDLAASDVPGPALIAIAASPLTRAIVRVVLRDGRLERLLPALLTSTLFDGIQKLSLRGCDIGGDDGATRIASAPALASIRVLDLAFCDVHERGVAALLASPHLTALSMLRLDANSLDPYGELGPTYWDALNEQLDARGIELTLV